MTTTDVHEILPSNTSHSAATPRFMAAGRIVLDRGSRVNDHRVRDNNGGRLPRSAADATRIAAAMQADHESMQDSWRTYHENVAAAYARAGFVA